MLIVPLISRGGQIERSEAHPDPESRILLRGVRNFPTAGAGSAGPPAEAKLMPNIELLLSSALITDTLSALLRKAKFSVLREPSLTADDTTVILDFDDRLDLERIRAHQRRGAKVVVLASQADSLTMSVDEMAPLSGVLTHDLSGAAFVRSLRLICSGERVFPRDLLLDRNSPVQPSDNELPSGGDRLSPREKEMLSQVVEGRSNTMIARRLGMTEASVKVHLKSVLRKIRVENRTQAVIWALANLPELGDTRRGSV